jgi:hypothetical protein
LNKKFNFYKNVTLLLTNKLKIKLLQAVKGSDSRQSIQEKIRVNVCSAGQRSGRGFIPGVYETRGDSESSPDDS